MRAVCFLYNNNEVPTGFCTLYYRSMASTVKRGNSVVLEGENTRVSNKMDEVPSWASKENAWGDRLIEIELVSNVIRDRL